MAHEEMTWKLGNSTYHRSDLTAEVITTSMLALGLGPREFGIHIFQKRILHGSIVMMGIMMMTLGAVWEIQNVMK